MRNVVFICSENHKDFQAISPLDSLSFSDSRICCNFLEAGGQAEGRWSVMGDGVTLMLDDLSLLLGGWPWAQLFTSLCFCSLV